MADENTDQAVEGETTPETEVEILDEALEGAPEPELDDDGNPIEVAEEIEDDSEEVEIGGQKVRLSKAAKETLAAERLMQADYTRKTQEVAEERREVAAARSELVERFKAVAQQSEDVINAKATVLAIDARIAEYNDYDWDGWEQRVQQLQAAGRHEEAQSDALALQAAYRQHQRLKEARQAAVSDAAEKTTKAHREAQEADAAETQRQLTEGHAVLSRDIPGWSPETAKSLVDFGVKAFGFTPQELSGITDPRVVKALHAAFSAQGAKETQAKTAATQRITAQIVRQQAVQPAVVVGGRQAPTRPSTATPAGDSLSTADWMKAEDERERRKGAR